MPGRSKRRARRRRGRRRQLLPQLPVLEQHHRDLIGLGLVALAAFFACVFYLGWAGGEVGEAVADGILFLFGGVGYLTPIVLFATGALLLLEPMLPTVKPFRSGAICLICGLLLALGAGALGPDRPGDAFITDADELRRHGGLVGEGLYWIASTLFSDAGAHILFAFLLLAVGSLLLRVA